MNIVLVNPSSGFLINDKAFPPLGLLYLSSALKHNGFKDISIIDMNGNGKIPEEIDADIVGISSTTPQFPEALRMSLLLKGINKNKKATYVFGGSHVSAKPEDIPEEDIALVGEGENSFLDIVRRKSCGLEVEKVVRGDYIKNIDNIEFPDRDAIDINSYSYLIEGVRATSIITSRGCPYGCYFCSNNVWGKSLRKRSALNVVDEMYLLRDKYRYGAVMFWDDTMTVDRSRMEKLCDLISETKMLYRCNIRSDTVDFDILKKMRRSGCVEVAIGVESGSQRILDIVNKGESIDKSLVAIKLCHAVGLRVKGFFIIGLPGENKESIRETEDFLRKAGLDDVDFSIYSPFPGSYIYKNMDKFSITFNEDYGASWYKGVYGKYKSLLSTSELSGEEIVKIRDDMERKYKNA